MISNYWQIISLSISIALTASFWAVLFGVSAGYIMYKYKFKGQFLLEIIFLLPIVLPPSVIGFILLVTLGTSSPLYPLITSVFGHSIIFTKTAAIIAAAVVAFPLVYQAAKVGFKSVDYSLIEAARLDCASDWQIMKKISLPLASNIIISGIILATARAFGEFGATLMVAGNIPGKTQTIPTAIYMAMSINDRTTAFVLVITMIVISVIFLLIIKYLEYIQSLK